jgi:hypothetical protein
MSVAKDLGTALVLAAIHNLSMLSLITSMAVLQQEDSKWEISDDYDFLAIEGKFIFPATMPKTTLHMLEMRLGESNLTFVELGSEKKDQTGFSDLWKPGMRLN